MVQLSKQADYGIVILTHFARLYDSPLLSAKDVSKATHLSLPMTSKILKILVKGALLKSYQGAKGGYQLCRNPSEISIASIIEVMDGPLALTECTMSEPGNCKTETSCSVKPHWGVINQVIKDALMNLHLSSMAAPVSQLQHGDWKNHQSGNQFFPLLIKQEMKK